MSIFGKIRDAIFGKKAQGAPAPKPAATPTTTAPGGTAPVVPTPHPEPKPIETVDVEAKLAGMAQGRDLNWRTSIVDLMKLLDIDSSLANRKELAQELGYNGELDGSAEMNIWLHKATMRELAANGGKVPADMLD